MQGLHKTIKLSFLIVGHTKFSPDSCFGLLKQKFRRTAVSCLDNLVGVVESSAEVNTAQLVGTQSGEVMVPTYDWAEYLGRFFVKIQGIKSLHHFHFAASEPGVVSVQMFHTSTTEKHTILANTDSEPKKGVLPSKITPKGMSLERKWYLYNKIREYCTESTKDIVCPYPGPGPCPPLPSPSSCNLPPSPPHLSLASTGKRRSCSHCGEGGHNVRSCKKKKVHVQVK